MYEPKKPHTKWGFLLRFSKSYFALPIRNIRVPQLGHFASIAGFPFFMVTGVAFSTCLFSRHFTQYIVTIVTITSSQQYA